MSQLEINESIFDISVSTREQEILLMEFLVKDPILERNKRRIISANLALHIEKISHFLNCKQVIEIGAHAAEFSLSIKKKYPSLICDAYEGNSAVFKKYENICIENGVNYINKIVNKDGGMAFLSVPVKDARQKSTMGSLLKDSFYKDFVEQSAPALSFSEVMNNALSPVFMWVDVEGAIGEIFNELPESFSKVNFLFVELETIQRWPGQMLAEEFEFLMRSVGMTPAMRDIQREFQYNCLFIKKELIGSCNINMLIDEYLNSSRILTGSIR
jgi:FkbM family methyltransferase